MFSFSDFPYSAPRFFRGWRTRMSNTTFTVTFIGFDGLEYYQNCKSLPIAQQMALLYSEHGGQCIVIVDDNGVDYGY